MISDDDLYSLAVFLGSIAMLLIVLYHFLEVNAVEAAPVGTGSEKSGKQQGQQPKGAIAKAAR